MASRADSGEGSKRRLTHAAPWIFDAAILVLQAAIAIYAVIWLAMSLLLREWMPHWWVFVASKAFHEWLGAGALAVATPWLMVVEELVLLVAYVVSYAWTFSKASCGTLGQQLFGRASPNALRHRAARNVLALVLHNVLAQLLFVWLR
jgi:hypothetical protein